jgi:hypothetical protein
MRGPRNPDPFIRQYLHLFGARQETTPRIRTEIDFVMMAGDVQRLGQLPRSGTELLQFRDSAPSSHYRDAPRRFDRSKQNETIRATAFDQHVQHPMNAVVKINVGGTGMISSYERARARTRECVGCLVILGKISFGFDNDPGTTTPDQRATDQSRRAD